MTFGGLTLRLLAFGLDADAAPQRRGRQSEGKRNGSPTVPLCSSFPPWKTARISIFFDKFPREIFTRKKKFSQKTRETRAKIVPGWLQLLQLLPLPFPLETGGVSVRYARA